jgi:hypothetical protein
MPVANRCAGQSWPVARRARPPRADTPGQPLRGGDQRRADTGHGPHHGGPAGTEVAGDGRDGVGVPADLSGSPGADPVGQRRPRRAAGHRLATRSPPGSRECGSATIACATPGPSPGRTRRCHAAHARADHATKPCTRTPRTWPRSSSSRPGPPANRRDHRPRGPGTRAGQERSRAHRW